MKNLTHTTVARLFEASKKAWRWVPIIALYRGIRAMNRGRWKIFLTTFFLSLWLGTAIAQAADGGTGISSLIPLEDWSNGGGKTLVEDVPTSAYTVESTKGGFTNPVIATMTGVASTLMLTVAEIGYIIVAIMSWLLGSAVAFEDSLDIAPLLGASATESLGWLFPSCLALGALFTYFDYLKEKAAFNGVLSLVIVAVAAISLSLYPNVWVSGLETARAAGNKVVSSISNNTGRLSTAPFEYGSVSFSSNTDSQAFARQASDTVWRQMVVTPWCTAQFGSVEVCQKYGKELLTQQTIEEKKKYLSNTVLKEVGEDSPTGQIITGDNWSQKLSSTFIAIILVIIMGFLIASLVFSAVIAFFQALLLLLLGVFFLPLGMIPGVTRSWVVTWAMMLAGAVMANVMAMLMLSVSIGLVTEVSLSDMSWGRQFFVSLLVLFAAFSVKHTVATITGSGSTNGGGFGRSLSRMVQAVTMRKMFNSALSYRSSRSNSARMNNNSNQKSTNQSSGHSRVRHGSDPTTRSLSQYNRLHNSSRTTGTSTHKPSSTKRHSSGTPTILDAPAGSRKVGKSAGNFHRPTPANGVVRKGSYSPGTGYRETVSPSPSQAPGKSSAPVFARKSSDTVASSKNRQPSSRTDVSPKKQNLSARTSAPINNGLRIPPPPARRNLGYLSPTAPKRFARESGRSARIQANIKARQAKMRARSTAHEQQS